MPLYELFCGNISSLLVAPIMTVIDTAVIKTQLQKMPLKVAVTESLNDFSSKKLTFGRPFGIMYLVYASTYSTANLVEYGCKQQNIDYKIPTLIATSVVNMSMISFKDKEYTKLFDQKQSFFPKRSYVLFAFRDSFTIGSCFILKKDFTHFLNHYIPHNIADFVSSLFLPMIAQTVSTPLHILAIDFYQRPNVSFTERFSHIQKMYGAVCSGRVIRVIPAFCLGGFINDMLRDRHF